MPKVITRAGKSVNKSYNNPVLLQAPARILAAKKAFRSRRHLRLPVELKMLTGFVLRLKPADLLRKVQMP